MAVDAIFKRAQLEEGFNVGGLGGFDFSIDLDGPGARGQASGILRRRAFVYAELVEVVVRGDRHVGGEFLARGSERTLDCVELGSGEGTYARGKDFGKAISTECGGTGCDHAGACSAAETSAVEVLVFGSDRRRGNVGRFTDW